MIVVLKDNPDKKQLENLIAWLESMGLGIHMSEGQSSTIMGLIGDTSGVDVDLINALDIVEAVKRVQEPYKNVNRKFHPDDSVIEIVPGVKMGGGNFQVIAGPCSVESEEQVCEVAMGVKAAGAKLYRGGAFKPRTSPYAFQGMREEGIKLLLAMFSDLFNCRKLFNKLTFFNIFLSDVNCFEIFNGFSIHYSVN